MFPITNSHVKATPQSRFPVSFMEPNQAKPSTKAWECAENLETTWFRKPTTESSLWSQSHLQDATREQPAQTMSWSWQIQTQETMISTWQGRETQATTDFSIKTQTRIWISIWSKCRIIRTQTNKTNSLWTSSQVLPANPRMLASSPSLRASSVKQRTTHRTVQPIAAAYLSKPKLQAHRVLPW